MRSPLPAGPSAMRNCWACGPKRAGAAAVEFALVAPLLLIFLYGIIEFGRLFMVMEQINEAARNGARILSMPQKYVDNATAAIDAAAQAGSVTTDGTYVGVTINLDATGGTTYTQVYNQAPGATSRSPSGISNSTYDATYSTGTTIKVTVSVNYSSVTWLPMFASNSKVNVGTSQTSLASHNSSDQLSTTVIMRKE